jgi:hypothetical protein
VTVNRGGKAASSERDEQSMKDRQMNLFKTRLLLIVAFLAIIALALALHQLIR